MKLSGVRGSDLATVALLLLAPTPVLSMLDCSNLLLQDHKFNFGELKGPHSVVTSWYDSLADTYHNMTYTLDLCGPLKRSDDQKDKKSCPNGTRVCAIEHLIDAKKNTDSVAAVIPIAKQTVGSPKGFEYDAVRLSTSDNKDDSSKEGVRLTLKGGSHAGIEQRAVVELLCNATLKGDEGEWTSEDQYVPGPPEGSSVSKRDDQGGDLPERQLMKPDAALVWEKYEDKADHSMKVLYLTWHTKFACEKAVDNGGSSGQTKESWGFFTWIVIIMFLATAAYLIFGSWLNYNRYGARGWDLLPHGDTIRDVPYLLKDMTRRFLNTVQGSGSRGGYSAV